MSFPYPFVPYFLKYLTIYRLVSAPASIAIPHLGDFDGPLTSSICAELTNLGNHLLAESRSKALASGRTLTLVEAVPAHFLMALRRAYAEINLLDDFSIVMAYLNKASPTSYPDPEKLHRAMLLLPGEDLVEHERDQASQINALNYAFHHGII